MTKMNFDEVSLMIMEECEKRGWEFCCCRPVSNHPDDWYLAYCVVVNEKGENVSYEFNAERPQFFWGHYFNHLENAMKHFDNR
jgi:hypothetical protein